MSSNTTCHEISYSAQCQIPFEENVKLKKSKREGRKECKHGFVIDQ